MDFNQKELQEKDLHGFEIMTFIVCNKILFHFHLEDKILLNPTFKSNVISGCLIRKFLTLLLCQL